MQPGDVRFQQSRQSPRGGPVTDETRRGGFGGFVGWGSLSPFRCPPVPLSARPYRWAFRSCSVARSVARSANNNGNALILRGIRSAIWWYRLRAQRSPARISRRYHRGPSWLPGRGQPDQPALGGAYAGARRIREAACLDNGHHSVAKRLPNFVLSEDDGLRYL